MRTAIIIATTGRAHILRRSLARYATQTAPPDMIVIVYAEPADVPEDLPAGVVAIQAPKGATSQRNAGLAYSIARADIVAFVDDDYLPSRKLLETARGLFLADSKLNVVTGQVLADGARRPEAVSFEEAEALLEKYDAAPSPPRRDRPTLGVYGCNMIVRVAAIGADRFDERLPLYGWQEDIDFTSRIARRGKGLSTNAFAGVHLGVKSGRVSGLRFGYSQIINPLYLTRKGTMRAGYALKLIAKNITANVLGSMLPSPRVDRRGRLAGNAIGIAECVLGRARPERILSL